MENLSNIDLISDQKLHEALLQLTKMCSLCNKSLCPGGYNCRNGAINMKSKICYEDFMFGNCKRNNCLAVHLTQRGFVPFNRQKNGFIKTFNTLELPDLNNQKNISCIPKGKYNCIHTYSQQFKKFTYEVLNVPNRKGIRIHATNYYYELRGCIALGNGIYDINNDKEIDLLNSKKAIEEFETLLIKHPFILTIT